MSSRPKSLFYELMDFTFELSKNLNISPFSIMKEDKDEVIMLMNYFIEKGEEQPEIKNVKSGNGKNERVRVNDDTATGGWF